MVLFVCKCINICVCTSLHMLYKHTSTYTYIYIYTLFIFLYICVCAYIPIYINTNLHILVSRSWLCHFGGRSKSCPQSFQRIEISWLRSSQFLVTQLSAPIEQSFDASFDLQGLRRAVLWIFGMNMYQMWGPKWWNAIFF